MNLKLIIKCSVFTVLLYIIIGCNKDDNLINLMEMYKIKNVTQEDWNNLASKKIFFGHQSVGYNLIDGLEENLNENPIIGLKIIEGNNKRLLDTPVFLHSKNGQNKNPKSKIDSFYAIMLDGLGSEVDIAGFKFCYIDFNDRTDVEDIFKYYKLKMEELYYNFPNIKIIHYTVPLKVVQKGPKAFIKRLFGKDIGILDNAVRQKFNNLLLREFEGQPIFDLAQFQSTYPDGHREYSNLNGKKTYSMVSTYSSDGGHLSELGKRYLSKKWLLFLLEQSDGR